MDDSFILTALVTGAAFWLGWHIRGIILVLNMSRDPDKMMALLKEIQRIQKEETDGLAMLNDIERTGREIKIEQVRGAYYIYAKDNDEFLGQGTSEQEAMEAVCQRYPDMKFWCKKSEEVSQTA